MLYYFLSVFVVFYLLILSARILDKYTPETFSNGEWVFSIISSIISPFGVIFLIVMWIPELFKFLIKER